jgi:thiamine pyrophosphokinase
MVDGGETVRLVQATLEEATLDIHGASGDLISLLPLGEDAIGVTTEALLYPLQAETLHLGSARGVSNVLTSPQGRVTLRRGRLLVIHTRKEER